MRFLEIQNGTQDRFEVLFSGGGSLGGQSIEQFEVVLWDQTGTVFSDLNLVDDFLRINHFSSSSFSLSWYVGSRDPYGMPVLTQKGTRGSITSLVPEPSSLSLLLAGGAVIAAAKRRRLV